MDVVPIVGDSPFAFLTFLAAPAILTNASSLLVLSTANRLARASDRARFAAGELFAKKNVDDPVAQLQLKDFNNATKRAGMLVSSLRAFYGAAGSFAASTCVALAGAVSSPLKLEWTAGASQYLTVLGVMIGIVCLVAGSVRLVAETRIALKALDAYHATITQWRATHQT